ncbi:MAG: hypothetical protein R3C56_08780 [Pirellulaceae bacterium]
MNDEFMSQVQSKVLAPWQKGTEQFHQYVQKTASQEDEDIVLWTQTMAANSKAGKTGATVWSSRIWRQ